MKLIITLCLLVLIQACNNDKNINTKFKYIHNFKYFVDNHNPKILNVRVLDCGENDFVKYGVLSELILKDLKVKSKVNFYFFSVQGKKDSLKFDKSEVITIKKNFKKNPCLIKSCYHIIKNITNEKIMFYDKILFEIMIFEAKLNKVDSVNYAKDDVSIISLIHNLCLYPKNNPGNQYKTQSNYLKVLHIWCEDRKIFPLYDKKDFIIR
jgi:hypothetical protein